MVLDGRGSPPSMPSEAQEQARLRRRLASVFMHMELRYVATKRVLAPCTVPFWNRAKTRKLFGGGIDLMLHLEMPLSLDCVLNFCEITLEIVASMEGHSIVL